MQRLPQKINNLIFFNFFSSIYNAEVNNNAALSSGLQIINVNSCDIEDVTPQALLDSSHASANNLECNLCQAPFSNDSELQQHRLSHSSQMTCSHCEKIFSQYDYLSNHTRDNHADQFLDFQKKTLLNGLECRVAIRLLKIPECTTCGSIFWNENNLKIHVQEEHSIVQIEEPPVSDQQKNVAVNGKADKHCQKCNHTFIRIDSYLKHMEAHIVRKNSVYT